MAPHYERVSTLVVGPFDATTSPYNSVYVPRRTQRTRAGLVGAGALILLGIVATVFMVGDHGKSTKDLLAQKSMLVNEAGSNVFSEEPAGIYTGHSHGPLGGRLTFGKDTYWNIFSSNHQQESICHPGAYLKKSSNTRGDACSECIAGKWCTDDVANDCPDGTTSPFGSDQVTDCTCLPGTFATKADSTKCKPCAAGSICLGGGDVRPCPANSKPDSTATKCECTDGYYTDTLLSILPTCKPCPADSYCAGGMKLSCPANSGAPAGSNSVDDCVCNEGYYLKNKICQGCPKGFYCPGGSEKNACPGSSTSAALSTSDDDCKCPKGFYGTNPTTCIPCPSGYFCTGNMNRDPAAAAPGSYFPAGSTSSTDSVKCPLGYLCAGGSSDKVPCVTPGMYCPVGSIKAQFCPVGFYCAGDKTTGPMDKAECTCDPGRYCNQGTASMPGNSDTNGRPCPAGYYCEGGTADKRMCTAAVGSYCPPSSASPEGVVCDAAGYYCPGGSSDKVPCTAASGYYCPAGSSDKGGVQCPPGYYCEGGSKDKVACNTVAGRYCNKGGSNPRGTLCPLGYYCPGGSSNMLPCQAPAGKYCPEGTGTTEGAACPVGSYCTGGQSNAAVCTAPEGRFCDVGSDSPVGKTCPQGFYCTGKGVDKTPCRAPPGSYCPATTATSFSPLLGVGCVAGTYCLGGQNDQKPCAAQPGRYCPTASADPAGTLCPIGYYCDGKVKAPCTAPEGNYCPAGSSDPNGVQCPAGYQCVGGSAGLVNCPANPGSYCPAGSAAPKTCEAGMYCPGGSAAALPCQAFGGSYCPAGTSAVQGVKCPAGFSCAGGKAQAVACQATPGRFCPEGNYKPTGDESCPENTYCPGGNSKPLACSAQPGSYCPKGSTKPEGEACPVGFACSGGSSAKVPCSAPAGNYCPEGSSSPDGAPCPIGYYCAGGGSDKLSCNAVPGKYCAGKSILRAGNACPAGFWCPGGASDKRDCSAIPGNYCPAGTSSSDGVPCAAGDYCAGGTAAPASCPSPLCSTKGVWSMFLYTVPTGTYVTPLDVTKGTLIGKNHLVPRIDFSGSDSFRRYVPQVGNDWFGWVFYGSLLVKTAGTYVFCITSDDGSLFYIDPTTDGSTYRMLIDDDGLHGGQQICQSIALTAGAHDMKVTGFQAAGGVMMLARYSGPDTNNQLVILQSQESTVPPSAAVTDGWTLQVFSVPSGTSLTPVAFPADKKLGESSLVPTVQEGSGDNFRAYVPQTPNDWYGWRFYGRMAIYTEGTYTFCSTSDDGSLFYLDLIPDDPDLKYTLLINNDGWHGPQQVCTNVKLAAGTYKAKVTGFQAGGGVYMMLQYRGPDTQNNWAFVRSVNSKVPSKDESTDGWTMQLYKIPPGTEYMPIDFDPSTLIGASSLVPSILFNNAANFQAYVPNAPPEYLSWRFFGKLRVGKPGEYTFCITSDDGSLLYMDVTPRDGSLAYALLVDDDGLHGMLQRCRAIKLEAGDYPMKVVGFQNAGGIGMTFVYRGPDTENNWWYTRSVDPTPPPADQANAEGWTMQIYNIPPGTELTPLTLAAGDLVGQSNKVPTISFDSGADFRRYMSKTPNEFFAFRFYGVLRVTTAGAYTLCTSSDDGSLLYMDLSSADTKPTWGLMIDNDGLHGMRQYCRSIALDARDYNVKIKGFQNYGGVGMRFVYNGPDTQGQWWLVRSADSRIPQEATDPSGWTMQIYSIRAGEAVTPPVFDSAKLVGQSNQVPTIYFDTADDFRRFVPKCPNEYFEWRLYGKLRITTAGQYNLCITSDDGSQLYMDLAPNDAQLNYMLVVNNDGLHGMVQMCKALNLAPGDYQTKVTGFQNAGGVGMAFTYAGPDTSGQYWTARSVDSNVPSTDTQNYAWTVQIYGLPGSPSVVPNTFAASALIGTGLAPTIQFYNGDDFRRWIPSCPNTNFGWAIYGTVPVVTPGSYTFCIASDDGSKFFIDPRPDVDKNLNYQLLVNMDGLHGPARGCGAINLAQGDYHVKVTGFQNQGGVYMELFYVGPDTGGSQRFTRSVDATPFLGR